ncbi:MAG: leucyl aminopeptidase family protein [Gammaproteobacteria bacterium]|nr:leucyl aminopeptidase family protein [Gammaproteobacteria bacterium]
MLIVDDGRPATAVEVVTAGDLAEWRGRASAVEHAWLDRFGFAAGANAFVFLPGGDGAPDRVLAGLGEGESIASLGHLAMRLPAGDYRLEGATEPELLALGWGLGGYQFTEYRKPARAPATLLIPPENAAVLDELEAVNLCRNLVNTPTSDMLPHHLEDAARRLAERHEASIEVTVGDELLRRGFNTIHTVGRASASPPRLIDIRWGDAEHPEVTLVGKGVCFDSGGLDIKSASGMRLMKKDMGGAAHVLGLAHLVMQRRLPVSLRVLVPAVENAIAGNAFRPGDVIRTYAGTTVEIDNTDAEGRLILCDALTLAAEDEPEALIDFATLTGAARSALGPELPAMFSNDDDMANGISAAGNSREDPVWRMPLHADYLAMLDSTVADIANAGSSPYAGAITAALYLQRFVGNAPWAHFDIMAWNTRRRPAHPLGGEAMGLRAVFGWLAGRFGG